MFFLSIYTNKISPGAEAKYFIINDPVLPDGWVREGLFQLAFVRNRKFLTAFSATGCQNSASVCRFHALTKTVNGLAATVMRLKCTFHDLSFLY